jgi:inorganic triphosphatase YgiF
MTEREVELKLELGRQYSADLAHSLARLGAMWIDSRRLVSRYFDTQTQILRENDLTLRVRSIGQKRLQTIKAARSKSAGLFDRAEWEAAISGDYPDLTAAEDTPVPQLIGNAALELAFTIEVERTIWRLATPAVELEVAFDTGEARAKEAVADITEVEIELKRGARRDLFEFAKELFRDEPMRIAVLAKSERGYLLLNGDARAFFKAEPVSLRPEMTTADAFIAIAYACLRHFRLNEPGIVQGRLPEAVHQARVAMRRLRSAFSLFRSILADDEARMQRVFLRELSQFLGSARNLDVFLSRQEAVGASADAPLTARLTRDRTDAYERLIKVLDEPAFGGRLLDLVAWIECGRWRNATHAEHPKRLARPIDATAPRILQRRWDTLRKSETRIDKMSAAARHKIRIKAKKLRYASEFFAGLYSGASHKLFVSRLARLQDDLGELNDIETGKRLLAELQAEEELAFAEAAAPSASQQLRTEAQLLDDAVASFRRLKETPIFWA